MMKSLLCLIVLINYSYCRSDYEVGYHWHGHIDRQNQGYEDYHIESIERPCSNHDVNCIRSFLSHKTGCDPVHGHAPDPYIFKTIPLELPHCNITVVLHGPQIHGLNTGKIEEFYINKRTDTLVLEVEFDSLVVYTPHTVAIYHRKGKESIKAADQTVVEFKHLSLTLNIENVGDIEHSRSHVYAYFPHDPPFEFGPGIVHAKDPFVARVNRKWMHEMSLSAREAFLTQGSVYMSAFLNNLLCDFRHV